MALNLMTGLSTLAAQQKTSTIHEVPDHSTPGNKQTGASRADSFFHYPGDRVHFRSRPGG